MRDTAPGGFVGFVVAGTRRRRLAILGAVAAAVMVVGGVAITRPTHQALPQPAGQGASSPATIPTASPTTSLPASQSAADARAYGIDPAVAALPIGVRVFQPDPASWPLAPAQASTPEGLWLVSLPYVSPDYDDAAHPEAKASELRVVVGLGSPAGLRDDLVDDRSLSIAVGIAHHDQLGPLVA